MRSFLSLKKRKVNDLKRKANVDGAIKSSKTPYRNQGVDEFSNEFAADENAMKGANRNSKQGRKGRG
jgi:hypothetical protein